MPRAALPLVSQLICISFFLYLIFFRREQFLHWVEELPARQVPAWLGLPNNAEKVLLTTQGKLYPLFSGIFFRLTSSVHALSC